MIDRLVWNRKAKTKEKKKERKKERKKEVWYQATYIYRYKEIDRLYGKKWWKKQKKERDWRRHAQGDIDR